MDGLVLHSAELSSLYVVDNLLHRPDVVIVEVNIAKSAIRDRDHFRRHELAGTLSVAGGKLAWSFIHAGRYTEINQDSLAILVHHDVKRLDILVDQVVVVHHKQTVFQSAFDTDHHCDRVLNGRAQFHVQFHTVFVADEVEGVVRRTHFRTDAEDFADLGDG